MELFSFVFGAIIGSFLNVLILRLPLKRSFITPRSYCFSCKKTIPWYYNIPILSYLYLKGKCGYCEESFSSQYFWVEVISGVVGLLLFLKLSISYEFLYMSIFFYLLIVLSFIDFKYKAVPDYLLILVFFFAFLGTNFDLLLAFKNAFLFAGAFVLLNFVITFYIQNIKSKLLKDESLKTQEALGEGDIPIIASFAIILGINSTLVVVFLAAIFAIIPALYSSFVKKDIQTPFIPYLALGFTVEYFFNIETFLKVFY